MKVIAIIPARSGSKGVPGKNSALVCGKPLISYTIEAALASKFISKIVVSSDGDEILNIAKNYSQVFIHERNASLASDTSPITETVAEILKNEPSTFDYILLLQPTAPIRTGEQIDQAIAALNKNDACNTLISVVAMDDIHPARMYWQDETKQLNPILEKFEQYRRQDIPSAYYRNGSMYLTRTEAFAKSKSLMSKPLLAFEMPMSQLLNIDEPRDMLIAEVLISEWKKGNLG